jgi:hypothetical protein
MANKQDAVNKQDALAKCIAEAVAKELAEDFKFLGEKLANLEVDNKTLIARLELLEEAKPTDAAKRTIRTTGGAKKAAAGSKAAANPDSKVSNALLYFRRGMQEDWHEYRATYATDDRLAEANADPTVSKKDINTNEGEYFSAVGKYLWTTYLTEENKNDVRSHFKAWKEDAQRAEADTQLDEEN